MPRTAVWGIQYGDRVGPSIMAGRNWKMSPGGGMDANAAIRGTAGGTLLFIEVQPGSASPGRLSYDRWRKRIRLSVRARAEGGKANEEVIERLAALLGAATANVQLTAGRTDRLKTVLVLGM